MREEQQPGGSAQCSTTVCSLNRMLPVSFDTGGLGRVVAWWACAALWDERAAKGGEERERRRAVVSPLPAVACCSSAGGRWLRRYIQHSKPYKAVELHHRTTFDGGCVG